LRHLFVVQTLGEVPDSFAVTAEQSDRVAAQAERLVQGEILRASDLLAAALSAIKDGSDPRIQLELALLKAAQPQADLSLQALLFRIEQLERRVAQATGAPEETPAGEPRADGAPSPGESAPPSAGPSAPPSAKAPAQRSAPAAAVAAVAVAADPDPDPQAAVDLDRLQSLWPAVVDAVRSQNAMVGACLEGARPAGLEADRVMIAFPVFAGFSRKTVERNREILQSALRAVTGP